MFIRSHLQKKNLKEMKIRSKFRQEAEEKTSKKKT